jgi:hypothetical protein
LTAVQREQLAKMEEQRKLADQQLTAIQANKPAPELVVENF